MSALKAQIDYSAPLYHIIDHFVIRALGYSAITARLPAFVGVFSLLIALYLFVSRRLSPIYGLLAAMLVLCTPARTYAWEGRPYGLVLGLAGVALLMYQRITDERRGDNRSCYLFYLLWRIGRDALHGDPGHRSLLVWRVGSIY